MTVLGDGGKEGWFATSTWIFTLLNYFYNIEIMAAESSYSNDLLIYGPSNS